MNPFLTVSLSTLPTTWMTIVTQKRLPQDFYSLEQLEGAIDEERIHSRALLHEQVFDLEEKRQEYGAGRSSGSTVKGQKGRMQSEGEKRDCGLRCGRAERKGQTGVGAEGEKGEQERERRRKSKREEEEEEEIAGEEEGELGRQVALGASTHTGKEEQDSREEGDDLTSQPQVVHRGTVRVGWLQGGVDAAGPHLPTTPAPCCPKHLCPQ